MTSIGRRLDRIEAAFAPTVTDEVRETIARIMADAPQLPEPTGPVILARMARFRELDFPTPFHPLQQIELAKRLADGRRRVAALYATGD